MATEAHVNIHGRRWGRGARPYIIMAKLLCVTALLGGLLSLLAMILLPLPPDTDAAWRQEVEVIHRGFVYLIIPGSTGAILTGLGLTASMWRVMIRMRWFVTKMVLVWAGLPVLHLFLRSRSLALQAAVGGEPLDLARATALRTQLLGAVAAAIVIVLALVHLGRIKPRLGQDYARAAARRGPAAGEG